VVERGGGNEGRRMKRKLMNEDALPKSQND